VLILLISVKLNSSDVRQHWLPVLSIGYEPMGLEGCSPPPPESSKAIIFGANAIFGGQSQQPKMKKMYCCVFI